jgi:hypothetical protein
MNRRLLQGEGISGITITLDLQEIILLVNILERIEENILLKDTKDLKGAELLDAIMQKVITTSPAKESSVDDAFQLLFKLKPDVEKVCVFLNKITKEVINLKRASETLFSEEFEGEKY